MHSSYLTSLPTEPSVPLLVLAILLAFLVVYLFYAVIHPERF
jgi:K+-transporting ATPase KdpF subunit